MKQEAKAAHELLIYMSAEEAIERIAQRVVQLQREGSPAFSPPQHSAENEDPIDTKEVCRILRLSRKTVEERRKDGSLPFHRMGKKVFFFKSEILAAMEGPKRLPGSRGTGQLSLGKINLSHRAA